MSVLLHRLGGILGRFGGLVVMAWVLLLGTVVGFSLTLGDDYDDSFTVPGTQSQQGQDLILDRFDQSGTSGPGHLHRERAGAITDGRHAEAVEQVAAADRRGARA